MAGSLPRGGRSTDARRHPHRLAEFVAPNPPIALAAIDDETVPGPGIDVPVRVYRPTMRKVPTVVYFHGGWMVGDLDSHDFLHRKLAVDSGLVFVAVDCRLAPEHPFPAGLDDCVGAAQWIADHLEDYGGLANKMAVAGDSSGGNLGAVVARTFRDRGRKLTAQLPLYLGGEAR